MSNNQVQSVNIIFDLEGNAILNTGHTSLSEKENGVAMDIVEYVNSSIAASIQTLINTTIDPKTGKNLVGAGLITKLFSVINIPVSYLNYVAELREQNPDNEETFNDEITAIVNIVASDLVLSVLANSAGLALLAVGVSPIAAVAGTIAVGVGSGYLYNKYLKDDFSTIIQFFLDKESNNIIYDATVYSQIASALGISLESFLSVGIDGNTNASHLVANNTRAVFRPDEEVKFYIPIKINGVEQVVAVEGVYNGDNLIIGEDSARFSLTQVTYPDILYLNKNSNTPIIITTGRSESNLEGTSIVIGSSGSDNIKNSNNSVGIFKSATIDGGDGSDTVDYSDLGLFTQGITANLETGAVSNGFSLNHFSQTIYNIENIIGSDGDDVITGNSSSNIFTGGEGNDVLSGGGGEDKLYGGAGDDNINGGEDKDLIYGGAGDDSLDGGFGDDSLYGGADDDKIDGGNGNDFLSGGSGNDVLRGGFNDDELLGNDGDDKLDGESGNDVLLGGRGFDTYNFSSSFGVDTVNDSDRFGKIVINGNEIKGDAVLLDEGNNGGSNSGGSGGSNNSSNDIHQLSINGVTYYLKMLSGVLLISQDKTAVEVGVGDVVKVEGFVNGQFGINLKNPEDPEFCAGPIVDGWRNAKATDPDAYYRIDPLTLDLDGDGVELVSLSNSNTFFDLDGDGLRENVGWIKSDDGILVYDANGSGSVDNINELFGDNSALGTAELASYDSNNDGVIDSNDAIFSKLQLWQDYDQDGISDEGELKHLSDYNITSINVKQSDLKNINQEIAGNVVLSSSTYNYTVDGVTRTNNIYNLELAINQTDSAFYSYVDEWGNVVDYDIDPETLTLPQSRGYGELHAWNVAMSENPDLFAKMQEIVDLSAGL